MRLRYNSPVVLSFALVAFLILILNSLTGDKFTSAFFVTYPHFDWTSPLDYFRLVSHVLGHKNWAHLSANFSVILLIGPILEEKYGSANLMKMMLITALVTGILNSLFFSSGLMGASGLAFLMILLGSFTNTKVGEIPLTFILVLVLFLAQEFIRAFGQDDVSQFAHILGGISGSIFGFLHSPKNASASLSKRTLRS